MDDKKIESYEEIHKKLVEAMQEACVHDSFDDYKTPYIDMSFIYEDEVSEVEPSKKKRFSFAVRFNKIAAIIIILLLGGNIVMMATDSGTSYGEKGLLHRLTNTITGVVTDNDNPADEDEVVNQYIAVTDEEIQAIKKKFPELYEPTYLPNGFELNELRIEFYTSGDCRGKYIYESDSEILTISLSYNADSDGKFLSMNVDENIEFAEKLTDRNIYVYKDINQKTYVADVFFENCMIDINRLNDKQEIIKIAYGLE